MLGTLPWWFFSLHKHGIQFKTKSDYLFSAFLHRSTAPPLQLETDENLKEIEILYAGK